MTSANNENERVTREVLYQQVWAEPMTTVALRYNVSSSFLARVCTQLKVPRPQRGYWAKLAAGKKSKQPALSEASPGDEIEWARYGEARRVPPLSPKPPEGKKRRHLTRLELPEHHPLLEGVREKMNEGRETYSGYLRPQKRLIADIIASKDSADRAIEVANQLYLLCEAHNHRVIFSPNDQRYYRCSVDEREKPSGNHYPDLWAPSRPTVVFIGTVAFGLTIFETSENVEVMHVNDKYIRVADITPEMQKKFSRIHTWTTTKEIPSGRLCLQVYSPYPLVQWVRQWREKTPGEFPSKFKRIIKELEAETATIAKLYEEGKRKDEIERQRREEEYRVWQAQEAIRRQIKSKEDSREELFKVIESWAEVKRIEEFFKEAECRIADIAEPENGIFMKRLELARQLIGSMDALQQLATWKTPEERLIKRTGLI